MLLYFYDEQNVCLLNEYIQMLIFLNVLLNSFLNFINFVIEYSKIAIWKMFNFDCWKMLF